MAHVRGHYRKDGTYVRPHTRRTKGASAQPRVQSAVPPAVRPSVPYPRPENATTSVRAHYRKDGTYVRRHRRRLGPLESIAPVPPVAVATGGGALLLLIVVVLLALFAGGGGVPPTAGPTPSASLGSARAPR